MDPEDELESGKSSTALRTKVQRNGSLSFQEDKNIYTKRQTLIRFRVCLRSETPKGVFCCIYFLAGVRGAGFLSSSSLGFL